MSTEKNTIKLLGIIALVAVIGFMFAACDNGGGDNNGNSNSNSNGNGNGNGGGGDTAVTLSSVSANGSSSQTTTQLTLTFTQAITGLSAADITLSGVSVTKGTLSGSGPAYTLPITVTAGGTLNVSAAKSGYTISGSPKQVTIFYYYSGGGNIAIEMVSVPGGSFQMGDPDSSVDWSDERPVHTVTLTGFYMGKYEVTQGQYQAVMGTTIQELQNTADPNSTTSYGRGDNYPVYYVSWYDAIVFCNKLSISEGRTPAYRINNSTDPAAWGSVPTSTNSTWNAATIVSGSTGYRLPTEAQWEYAAKGGNGSPGNYTYAGSNNVGDVAWYRDNIPSQSSGNPGYGTQPVGTKAPNGLGLYDMSGNVYESCWDWAGDYTSEAQSDPTGASSGSYRVVRGGRWGSARPRSCVPPPAAAATRSAGTTAEVSGLCAPPSKARRSRVDEKNHHGVAWRK